MDEEELRLEQTRMIMQQWTDLRDTVARDYAQMLERTINTELILIPPTDDTTARVTPVTSESVEQYQSLMDNLNESIAVLMAQGSTPINVPMMNVVESQFVPEGQAFVMNVPGFENVVVTPTRQPRTLRRGDSGQEVRQLQARLREVGSSLLDIDGIYGIRTETAVRAFQSNMRLNADGIAGPQTWRVLFDTQNQRDANGLRAQSMVVDEFAYVRAGMDDAFTRVLLNSSSILNREEVLEVLPKEEKQLPPEPFSISEFFDEAR